METELRCRVNRRAFMKYYRLEKSKKVRGSERSERHMAEEIGISHTQLQNLRRGTDSKGNPKRYVNLETARLIEHRWDVPSGIIFLTEMVDGRSTNAA